MKASARFLQSIERNYQLNFVKDAEPVEAQTDKLKTYRTFDMKKFDPTTLEIYRALYALQSRRRWELRYVALPFRQTSRSDAITRVCRLRFRRAGDRAG